MAGENKLLFIGKSMNTYEYDPFNGEETIYWRKVEIKTESDIEKAVIVTVGWLEKETPMEVKAEEHLFNWY